MAVCLRKGNHFLGGRAFPCLSLQLGVSSSSNLTCSSELKSSNFMVAILTALHCPLLHSGRGGEVRLCSGSSTSAYHMCYSSSPSSTMPMLLRYADTASS